jgi:tetratricopeptide (TPR) repeat protein
LTPLPNDAAWKRFLAVNSPAFATPDADVPASVANALNPRGLLMGAVPGDLNVSQNLWHFFATRGRYSYEAQPDFFTSDLIDAYSQMSFKEGTEKFKQDPASSFEDLNRAWAMHWIFPGPPAYLGYAAYVERQYPEALNFYQIAVSLGEKLDFLAQTYRALNGTIQSFKQSCSENMLQAGAIEEKLGNPQEARKWYLKSLATRPSAQAHYNLAVLTWNSDPQNSQKELEEALSIDPHYAPAVKYLQILRARVVGYERR